jgi:CTP synthase
MCRTTHLLSDEMRDKLALFCNVDREAVISAIDINTTIYEIPVIYEQQGLARIIEKKLGLKTRPADLAAWRKPVAAWVNPKKEVTIAVAGKYVEHQDAYKSIYEALVHGGMANACLVKVMRIDTEQVTRENVAALFTGCDGMLLPGGFGERGFEGMVTAARHARETGIPYFGICLGLHVMAVDFARHVLGHKTATSTEFNTETPYPVISLLEEQQKVTAMGGTMRLGAYPAEIAPGTKLAQAYKARTLSERHRHRYEFTNKYRTEFAAAGMVFSGINTENDLIEAMELADHPWFLSVQFHPEFKSKPTRPAPLFAAFVKACLATKKS